MTNLRAYFFGNMYLSPIQHGIQAAHVVTNLLMKYPLLSDDESISEQVDLFYAWASDHITKICLNGKSSAHLDATYSLLTKLSEHLPIPFDKFQEPGLDYCVTSVGVIVSDDMLVEDWEIVDRYDLQQLMANQYSSLDLLEVYNDLKKSDLTYRTILTSLIKNHRTA